MKNPLEEKRKKIDALDVRLAGLLERRFSVARSLTGLKKKILDPRREAAVLKRAAGLVKDRALRPAVTAVYRELIRQSRLLQREPR